jgi:hypothetical protein
VVGVERSLDRVGSLAAAEVPQVTEKFPNGLRVIQGFKKAKKCGLGPESLPVAEVDNRDSPGHGPVIPVAKESPHDGMLEVRIAPVIKGTLYYRAQGWHPGRVSAVNGAGQLVKIAPRSGCGDIVDKKGHARPPW